VGIQSSGAACGLLLVASRLYGQGTLTGRVLEENTHRPLSGVQILIQSTERQTTSDSVGRFTITGLRRGRGSALFRAIGLRPTQLLYALTQGKTFEIEVLMARAATELDPVIVNARPPASRWFGAEGFAERRRMGFGRFIDSAELRRSEMVRPADVLRRAQAGIELRNMADDLGTHVWAAGTRKLGPGQGPCWMQVVVDGVIVYKPGTTHHSPPDLANDYNVADLQAIEVYRSQAETPLEFGGAGADCGTIALWSRRGWESGPEVDGPPRSTAIAGRHRRIGLFGGISVAGVFGPGANQFGARRARVGMTGGMFLSIPIKSRLDFAPEAIFAERGVRGSDSGVTSVLKLRMIEVPLLAKLEFPLRGPSVHAFLQAGPVPSFRVGCTIRATKGTASGVVSCDQAFFTEKLGLGFLVGTGIELGPLVLAMRYDFALTSLQQSSALGAVRTKSFSVLSGLVINVGK